MTFETKLTQEDSQRFLEKLSQCVFDDNGPKLRVSVAGEIGQPVVTVQCDDPYLVIFDTLRNMMSTKVLADQAVTSTKEIAAALKR